MTLFSGYHHAQRHASSNCAVRNRWFLHLGFPADNLGCLCLPSALPSIAHRNSLPATDVAVNNCWRQIHERREGFRRAKNCLPQVESSASPLTFCTPPAVTRDGIRDRVPITGRSKINLFGFVSPGIGVVLGLRGRRSAGVRSLSYRHFERVPLLFQPRLQCVRKISDVLRLSKMLRISTSGTAGSMPQNLADVHLFSGDRFPQLRV